MEAELNSIVRISWLILNADVIEQKELARKNSVLQSSDNSCKWEQHVRNAANSR